MNKPCLINLNSIGDRSLGYITVLQHPETISFEIKRVYWTYYTPNEVIRGNHAHRALHQVIVATSGTINFELENVNGGKYNFKLDNPGVALYIPPLHWRTIQFSHNAVLLCMASNEYDQDDYIRDYGYFKNLLQ